MAVDIEDGKGVVKGPHHYLAKRDQLEKLEREVYGLLMEGAPIPISVIWRSFYYHLWEVSEVLRSLRDKSLVDESA
jgi:hypothetical protein